MKAIDFTLPANNGENVKLSDFLGKRVVLYFYPKDNTPGCTQEACNFRDNFERLTAKNVVVLGVSKDSIKKHEGFVAKQKLPFLLLSDENSDVCDKYGVWNEKINFGKKYFGIIRSTFLIDEKGEIIKEWRKVKVEGNVDEIIEELDK
mgnify:FL=1